MLYTIVMFYCEFVLTGSLYDCADEIELDMNIESDYNSDLIVEIYTEDLLKDNPVTTYNNIFKSINETVESIKHSQMIIENTNKVIEYLTKKQDDVKKEISEECLKNDTAGETQHKSCCSKIIVLKENWQKINNMMTILKKEISDETENIKILNIQYEDLSQVKDEMEQILNKYSH